jgi:hypothetical protein
MTGRAAQVVEHLLSKRETLSSSPSLYRMYTSYSPNCGVSLACLIKRIGDLPPLQNPFSGVQLSAGPWLTLESKRQILAVLLASLSSVALASKSQLLNAQKAISASLEVGVVGLNFQRFV